MANMEMYQDTVSCVGYRSAIDIVERSSIDIYSGAFWHSCRPHACSGIWVYSGATIPNVSMNYGAYIETSLSVSVAIGMYRAAAPMRERE